MNIMAYTLSCFLICVSLPAWADLISPQVEEAQRRLQANPNTYDRVDNFCKDKKPGASCTMPGTTFEGGGEGICKTHLSSSDRSAIEMSCIRQGEVLIDRGNSGNDQFCQGKVAGDVCSLELRYLGNTEHSEGICKRLSVRQNRYGAPRYRHFLRCEPLHEVEHTFSAVSWHEKLLP